MYTRPLARGEKGAGVGWYAGKVKEEGGGVLRTGQDKEQKLGERWELLCAVVELNSTVFMRVARLFTCLCAGSSALLP